MLKQLVKKSFCDRIYIEQKDLFYEIYKWNCGLDILISMRFFIGTIICFIAGLAIFLYTKKIRYLFIFLALEVFLYILQYLSRRNKRFLIAEHVKSERIHDFLMKFISLNGKAIGKKEWQRIKQSNKDLYKKLLSEECNHYCYYYSHEIAKILDDSILIWGAVLNPFSKEKQYFAHACIYRNGYIYDSNIHQSIDFNSYKKLFDLKIYRKWTYDEYSKNMFQTLEKKDFDAWCKDNNVEQY